MTLQDYHAFIASKGRPELPTGFDAEGLPECLAGHQRHMVEFACDLGSAACFYDTGLGKTLIELAFADQVRRHTGKPVMVLAPLAVGRQTAREAAKFGIDGAAGRGLSPIGVGSGRAGGHGPGYSEYSWHVLSVRC